MAPKTAATRVALYSAITVLTAAPTLAGNGIRIGDIEIGKQRPDMSLYRSVNTFQRSDPADQPREIPYSEMSKRPYNAALKLISGASKAVDKGCNAPPVEDRHILVTNAHCILKDGEILKPLKVYTGYDNNQFDKQFDAEVFWIGTKNPDNNHEDDVAVLYLKGELPAGIRPYRIDPGDLNRPRHNIQGLGYTNQHKSGKTSQALVDNSRCVNHIELLGCDDGDLIAHDCSFNSQGSGSALFYPAADGENYIVGINESEQAYAPGQAQIYVPYSCQTTNFGVKVSHFYEAVERLKKKLQGRDDPKASHP
jgi:hypothetical protein